MSEAWACRRAGGHLSQPARLRSGAASAALLCSKRWMRGAPPTATHQSGREVRCPLGSRARSPAAACQPVPHGSAPPGAARFGPPRPGLPRRDSWVPKGLSPQRGRPCPPVRPREPSAPARTRPPVYLRSPPRSSSTWPLSPGAAPQPAPSARRRAPCWLLGHGPGGGAWAITIY